MTLTVKCVGCKETIVIYDFEEDYGEEFNICDKCVNVITTAIMGEEAVPTTCIKCGAPMSNERAELYTEVLQYYAGELELEWDYIK